MTIVTGWCAMCDTRRARLQRAFADNAGVTLTRGWLAEHVWDGELGPESRAIDMEIVQARKRIEEGRIETVPGAGYRFRKGAEACQR